MDRWNEYETLRERVEAELSAWFNEDCPQAELLEAMRYSLLAGGKRIRPVLLLKLCEAVGGDWETLLPAACGIEMLHTYSLIHDDLPCMDNDSLRRGKPTCHTVFGETNAILAGDALQASAFRAVLSCDLPAERLAAMALSLAEAAGERGMCGGQYLDMGTPDDNIEDERLYCIHELKTGALMGAACRMGVQGGGGTAEQLSAAEAYAQALGLAFQIRDDVLDCTSTAQELGKSVGADAAAGKITFVTRLGLAGCERLIREYTDAAVKAAESAFPDAGFLCWLAETLAGRSK